MIISIVALTVLGAVLWWDMSVTQNKIRKLEEDLIKYRYKYSISSCWHIENPPNVYVVKCDNCGEEKHKEIKNL